MLNSQKGTENINQDNLFLWDPNMPVKLHGTIKASNWRLLDAYRRMKEEADIKAELRKQKIQDLQIQGVWLFKATAKDQSVTD